MNQSKIENVLKLNMIERHKYFIRKVCDFEQVWGLYDDGWATLGNSDILSIPFWPEKEFAILCATGDWFNYKPKMITLSDFIEKWIDGMKNNNQIATIFMTPSNQGINIHPSNLVLELNEELSQYD